jgi:two-component system LytT family response regulator
MKTIIIDDEERSHEVLKRLIKDRHPGVQIAASGYNVREGLNLLDRHRPDLVFLDIEMPDGTGFDLLQKVHHPKFGVVFITAHNKYAITAIHFGALDYLLKPLTAESLAMALERAQEKRVESQMVEQLRVAFESFQYLSQQKLPTRMLVSTLEGIHYIPVADIIRLEAQANCTEIFYQGAKKRLVASVNIGSYEEQFEPYAQFMRVHKSHIINLMLVDAYVKGDACLVLKDGKEIPVSREHREELLGRLKEI